MSLSSLLTRSMNVRLAIIAIPVLLPACGESPDGVLLELAPEVISSQDGTLHVHTTVIADRSPLAAVDVNVRVAYVDRNGVERAIEPVTGITDHNGALEAVFTGLIWDGAGTVTAEVVAGDGAVVVDGMGQPLAATATFSVLDRTQPTVTILPPTEDLRIGAGFPLDVQVAVEDEIGISEVIIEASGELDRLRSTVVASGASSAILDFDFDVPNDARPGPTITLHALAIDLSGNVAAAEPVVLTVDPTIAIVGADGLQGSMLSDGNGQFLQNPRALAMSPMDGMLYVADNSGNNPCNGGCIRAVDPATGTPVGGIVIAAVGRIEGIAFDDTGDNMYYTDRQDRVYRMTYNLANNAYENRVACNDIGGQDPQDPMHLLYDPAVGIVVVDRQDRRIKVLDGACTGSQPNNYNNQALPDNPWGIAREPGGDYFVSDEGVDRIYRIGPDGQNQFFEDRSLNNPRGIEWLAGGGSSFADSLLIANNGNGRILSSTGEDSARTAVYLRNDPVDIEYSDGTLYVLTEPSAGDPGRIFAVTGF